MPNSEPETRQSRVYFGLAGALAAGKLAVAPLAGALETGVAGAPDGAVRGEDATLRAVFGEGATSGCFASVRPGAPAELGVIAIGAAELGAAVIGGTALVERAASRGSTTGASSFGAGAAEVDGTASSALAGPPAAGCSSPLDT
jgi:hypothetical protein